MRGEDGELTVTFLHLKVRHVFELFFSMGYADDDDWAFYAGAGVVSAGA